jgi:aarF domain-containing kinase
MRLEVNLFNEAQNAERTARYLAEEPSLRNRVMIPKVHWKWTGESIMTAE